jgi:hypothetical protein
MTCTTGLCFDVPIYSISACSSQAPLYKAPLTVIAGTNFISFCLARFILF